MLFNVLITVAFVELSFVLKILTFVLLGLATFCTVAFCSFLFIVISYTLAYRGFACLHLLFLKNTINLAFFMRDWFCIGSFMFALRLGVPRTKIRKGLS